MQTNSIPASQVVDVTPNVLSAGGQALDVIALVLTTDPSVPIGTVKDFADKDDVASFFGSGSPEADIAAKYFLGFNGRAVSPDAILYTQYPAVAVAAYLRGGDVSSMTLAQLNALGTGSLTAVIDGYSYPAASINLSAVASPSAAAAAIQTGLNGAKPTQAAVTGAISTTVLTVSAVSSGALAVGQVISGAGVTVGTKIVAFLTGTGGIGTYTVSVSQTAASTAITGVGANVAVTYDSQRGAYVITSGNTGVASLAAFATGTLAASLKLTSVTGAELSQGAAATTPGAFMDGILNITQNWVTFMTAFDPDSSGNANKLLFAQWNNNQADEFCYVGWDTDVTPTLNNNAAASLGALIAAAELSGTALVWATSAVSGYEKAAFICGSAASIDFTRTNGRITFKFRTQDGLLPDVSNATVAVNLAANGYNFYGGYATRNQNFNFFANGVVSGKFIWLDSYINQIWMNNDLQLNILLGMTQVGSIPYNSTGYALIEAFCMATINAALNFGAIRAAVTLSPAQAAEVNLAAGANISAILQTRGWYLQIRDATAEVRAARGSPPCTLWYMDGGSVQKIDLDSIEVQ